MHSIEIRKAKENNLKGVDVNIPKGKITLITGVSGSGKSSLAHDVIYKEAQRLFVESMSNESRRLLKSFAQVDVESISGLSPVVAVSQKTNSFSSSSTVGILSGIYDYLRLLMARFSQSDMDIFPLKKQRRLFSFNTPYGACKECRGVGMQEFVDYKLIIKDENLSLRQGALKITLPSGYTVYSQVTIDVLNQVCNVEGFDVDIPWNELSEDNKNIILYGSDKIKIPFGKHSLESRMKWTGITAKPREEGYYRGIIPIMEEILKRDRNDNILRFVSSHQCNYCGGSRLNTEALSHYFEGKNMADFSRMDILEIHNFFSKEFKIETNPLAFENLRKQIIRQSKMLIDLGLGYLEIHRKASSLSSGELQRIRLANMAQSELSGLLYIFDEPSVGLHAADQHALIELMQNLKRRGNTIIVIEHEAEMIKAADYIIEIGPLAGKYGGELVFEGSIDDFLKKKIVNSKTQEYIFNNRKINIPKIEESNSIIEIVNADIHNLKSVNATFINKALNVVCGVSGSGKSSLVMDCLADDFNNDDKKYISNNSKLPKQIITIDQKAIGRTPRSNPATYTKIFDKVRALFAKLPKAKLAELKSSHFSFNTKGGRCEACQGAGYISVGMHFIGNVEVKCEECNGNRFQENILAIKYKNKNIKEVLDLSVEDAVEFFKDQSQIHKMLSVLKELGLGYITLGQRATSLSGGEAQRVKLATEMMKNTKSSTLYILDEPTTGLHSYDVEILLKAVSKLVKNGHTVIIIEHHEDVIRSANHIIELGEFSGKYGGNIIFEGKLPELLKANTATAKALNNELNIVARKENIALSEDKNLRFKNVSTNNLKSVDICIPKNELTVFTGVSGSGKSSMAFDTIYKAGRDAYFETFPTYLRSRMDHKSEAKFDSFENLNACISLEHKKSKANMRSTLGTYSGVYDLYRLLFSRISENANAEVCDKESGFFSFNKQEGACSQCKGLGELIMPNADAFIDNADLGILDGAISKSKIAKFYVDANGQYYWTLKAICNILDIDIHKAWNEQSEDVKALVLFGNNEHLLDVEWKFERKGKAGVHNFKGYWQGLSNLIFDEYNRKKGDKRVDAFIGIMKYEKCSICHGKRLNNKALSYEINGLNISELTSFDIAKSHNTLVGWQNNLSDNKNIIAKDIILELLAKFEILMDLDLGYIQLNRNLNTLSAGEMQRISLASSLGARMTDITYVFDEPSRALHPKNRVKVLKKIKQLCEEGNTVIAVEHSDEFINAADNIFEFGPAAGQSGGNVKKVSKEEIKEQRKKFKRQKLKSVTSSISLKSAFANNLKNIDVELPLNSILGIKGVSGSGKTSLLRDVIYKSIIANRAINCKSLTGLQHFDSCKYITSEFVESASNQNVAAYLKVIENIRKLFANTINAKADGCKVNYFSNLAKGKCNSCGGSGELNVKMDFISDVSEICPECGGSGFNADVLQYKYCEKNIAEVQTLNIDSALDFFRNEKNIADKLSLLQKIGLGYLPLSQKLKQLSLGEIQRLKLATNIIYSKNEKILFLLDEPSKGLSYKDIKSLFSVFDKLISQGHSIIMVEHNSTVLDNCDHIIELGPGAGELGGRLIVNV